LAGREDPRAGFTLIELLTVMVVIGILATIAVPRLRNAIDNADAAVIVEDARTILHAAVLTLYDTGQFPPDEAPGVVPAAFVQYLPGTDFDYEGVITYQWRTGVDADGDPTGFLYVDLTGHGGIGAALQRHESNQSVWTTDEMIFWLTP
jgi:prepilin-type N-terminal cleavage/methylation domain-containing protein